MVVGSGRSCVNEVSETTPLDGPQMAAEAGEARTTASLPTVDPQLAAEENRKQTQRMNPDAKEFIPTGKLEKRHHIRASEAEDDYAACVQKEEGVMVATTFNSLMNSSTRCEMGAALLGMSPEAPVHLGIDNAATVTEGNRIVKHLKGRAETKLIHDDGSPRLGGTTSHLQAETPI